VVNCLCLRVNFKRCMKNKRVVILSWVITLIPFLLCVFEYHNLIDQPNTKANRGGGIIVSKQGFLIVVFACGVIFHFVSAYIANRVAYWVLPKYENQVRILLVLIFAMLNISMILGNLK